MDSDLLPLGAKALRLTIGLIATAALGLGILIGWGCL